MALDGSETSSNYGDFLAEEGKGRTGPTPILLSEEIQLKINLRE
jgi:hypothetical protein